MREAPWRFVDGPADLRDLLRKPSLSLPPPRLRRRVGGVSARREFVEVGRRIAEDLRSAFERAGGDTLREGTWLDFGCGSGRVARHVAALPFVGGLRGVDVDAEAIEWARRHLPGRYEAIGSRPPTRLPSSYFDAAYAISVFTHFDADAEAAWLRELHRVLRPGGLLLATTSSPGMCRERPDMTPADRSRLEREGSVYLRGGGRDFNEETAYHSNEYLRRAWGSLFGQLLFLDQGAAGYQDLSVWVKW
jgi:SAM-dependent methyltransferase